MTTCPHCHSLSLVKNGKSYYGKQNHKCRHCRRQAVERGTGLVVGFHLGERDTEGARGLWLSIPQGLRGKAMVFTDGPEAYRAVLAKGQHQP